MLLSPTQAIACSRRCCILVLFGIVFILVVFAPARGQGGSGVDSLGTGGRHSIQGRIYFPSGRRTDVRVKVKLENFNSGELYVMSDANGSFSFRGLIPGSYTIVVDGADDYETARETVYIESDGSNPRRGVVLPRISRPYTVDITLRVKRVLAAKPGVLNAELANIPAPARELYQDALQSAQSGDHKKAVEQLKEALANYSSFPLALNELGVQYLSLNQPEKAVEVLAEATKLSPDEFTPRLNYGYALMESKRLADAETQLRQALTKNDNSWPAHMYLGMTLGRLRRYEESELELQRSLTVAGVDLAMPHYYLAGIYWAKDDFKRAADELEKYLKLAPGAPDAERTRTTIKDLRDKELRGKK